MTIHTYVILFDSIFRCGKLNGLKPIWAIVRELVGLHNGTIRVQSEAGMGSSLEVRIPAVQSAK